MSCDRCTELTGIIERLEASNAELGSQMARIASENAKDSTDATIAELNRQLAGRETQLRAAGSRETMLRTELNRLREEEPGGAEVIALLTFWRDEVKAGNKSVNVKAGGPRGKKVKWALKTFGEERCRKAIRGAKLDDWAMGRHPKIRNSGKTFNDIAKHILLDEETVERFVALYENGQQRPAPEGPTGVQALLARLEEVKPAGDGKWSARCPAHEDRHASLSVSQGQKGAVAKCHVGCTIHEIADAAGVPVTNLFDPEPANVPRPAPRPPKALPSGEQVLAWRDALLARPAVLGRLYDLKRWSPNTLKTLSVGIGLDRDRLTLPVTNEQGELVNVMRYKPARKGDEAKVLPFATGHGRNLFPAPELFPGEVWLVEGEPDAVSAHEMGLPAVAVPGTGGWRDEYAERFQGRQVFVCFDCDTPGRALVDRVSQALLPFAAEVWTVDLVPDRDDGYDLGDALLDDLSADSVRGLAVNLVTEVVG